MVMSEPPPINYKDNPYYIVSKADFDYTAPITTSGSNYPCRGHLKDLDTPQGQSVRNYQQGSTYNMVISGNAVHGGGSCQAALSYDKGTTWTVIKSWIGNCPHATPGGDQTFKFPIPTSAPSGIAIFAWTWFNNVGNREMYMNCAVVTIGGSGSSKLKSRALSGPSLFIANIGTGCTTTAGTDVVFPNPGTVVEYGGNQGDRAPPSGSCAQGQVLTGGGGGGTGSDTSGGSSGGGDTSDTTTGGSPTYTAANTGTVGDGYQSSKVYTYPTATDGVVYPGGTVIATNTDGGYPDVQGDLGCDYWRTQGYVCSAAAPTLLGEGIIMHISFGLLAFAWVCGFFRVF